MVYLIFNKKVVEKIMNKSDLRFFTQIGITVLLCCIISLTTAISIFGLSQYSLLLGLIGTLTSIIFPAFFIYCASGGNAILIHSNHVSNIIAVFSALNFSVSFFIASFLTNLIFPENKNTNRKDDKDAIFIDECFMKLNERALESERLNSSPYHHIRDVSTYENTEDTCCICFVEKSISSLLIPETLLHHHEKEQLINLKQNTPSTELLASLKHKDKICTECIKEIEDFGQANTNIKSNTKLCPITRNEIKTMYSLYLDYKNDIKIKIHTTKRHREYDNRGNVLLPLSNI